MRIITGDDSDIPIPLKLTVTEPPADVLKAVARLSSDFGAKQAEAEVRAGLQQLKRKPGAPRHRAGKDITRTLTADRQRWRASRRLGVRPWTGSTLSSGLPPDS